MHMNSVAACYLVHARLVLVHVRQREQALAAMVSVLRPGGWLVIEEADPALQPLVCLEEIGPAEALANRLKRGFRQLLRERGVDLAYGRTLPRRLRSAGLIDVSADAHPPIAGSSCTELERATIGRTVRPGPGGAGLMSVAHPLPSLLRAETRLVHPISHGLMVDHPCCPGVLSPGVRGDSCHLRIAVKRHVQHREPPSSEAPPWTAEVGGW